MVAEKYNFSSNAYYNFANAYYNFAKGKVISKCENDKPWKT